MIDHTNKTVFVHIPKTAGQSVEVAFLEQAGLSWDQRDGLLLKPNHAPDKGPPRLAHLLASEYVALGYLEQAMFDSYYKFGFVRNPWARLVSEYRYRNYPFSFKEFLLDRFPTPEDDDYQSSQDSYRHVLPQYQFLYDENDQCLVDFVGKFETLQEDFQHVTKRLFNKALALPHVNVTKKRSSIMKKVANVLTNNEPESSQHYRNYYDDETRQFVESYYARDIELFNYQFEG